MKNGLFGKLAASAILCAALSGWTATAVEYHGQLQVSGNQILGKHGQPAVLRGMSFYWSLPTWGKPTDYWNASVVNWLAEDWHANVVRAAMGVEPAGGYLSNAAEQEGYVKAVVDAAIAKGIYVIIDWHDHNAINNKAQALAFFKKMATTYGSKPNVIYEIFNEPTGAPATWPEVKAYSQELIDAIRLIDPDNLILVGNPEYDKDVDVATKDPVTGTNIAYTLHFYSGSHKSELRAEGDKALARNKAIFISEWGTTDYSGSGGPFTAEADLWIAWADLKKISMCNWSIHNITEESAALKSTASTSGNWGTGDLSTSGAYVRGKLRLSNPAANAYAAGASSSSAKVSSSSGTVSSSSSKPSSSSARSSSSATSANLAVNAAQDLAWIDGQGVLHLPSMAAYTEVRQLDMQGRQLTHMPIKSATLRLPVLGQGMVQVLLTGPHGRKQVLLQHP